MCVMRMVVLVDDVVVFVHNTILLMTTMHDM